MYTYNNHYYIKEKTLKTRETVFFLVLLLLLFFVERPKWFDDWWRVSNVLVPTHDLHTI